MANLRMATSRTWKDKSSGEKREETEWHSVVLYGRQADVVEEYVHKGQGLYVEGRLRTRKWADKDGVERYTTEVICESMQMIGGRDDGSRSGAGDKAGRGRAEGQHSGAIEHGGRSGSDADGEPGGDAPF